MSTFGVESSEVTQTTLLSPPVLIDFLIRHGGLTIENCDCDYVKLVCALHNDLRLPGP